MNNSLIQSLFDGFLDIVGDVHGEIDALRSLMGHLGYREDGTHPNGRRLVFLGDLTDRGPDSPAVVELVKSLVDAQRAQCVLGNHELNLLLERQKSENKWFYGEQFVDKSGEVIPQRLADDQVREHVLGFFNTLPLALERNDCRVVHACWHEATIELARQTHDASTLYHEHSNRIKNELASTENIDDVDRGLAFQNENPVKILTSGPEKRADKPFEAAGKVRLQARVKWWTEYDAQAYCVFGHYSISLDQPRGSGAAFCADYGVGYRWTERRAADFDGSFTKTKLAAVRMPEKTVMFDDGTGRACE